VGNLPTEQCSEQLESQVGGQGNTDIIHFIGDDGQIVSWVDAEGFGRGHLLTGVSAPPTPTALGGVFSHIAVPKNFLTSINPDGSVTGSQPVFSDISGVADPTQLPTPTTTTFGGVKDLAAVATKFLTSVVNGLPVAAQPAASDLSNGVTGSGGVVLATAPTLSAKNLNAVRYADQFSGADAGAKIAAAIADLPATGGTVDARAFEGAQTATALMISKPITLLLGAATYTFTSNPGITITDDGVHVIGLSKAATTIIPANTTGGAILYNASFTPGRMLLQDFTIDGTGLTNCDYGLKFDGGIQGYDATRIKIQGFLKAGAAALNIGNANCGVFVDCDFRTSTAGISFTGGAGITNLNNFYGGQVLGNTTGILSTGGDGNHFYGINIASNTASPAVWLKSGFANVIESCWFEVNATGASTSSIRLGDSSGGTFAQATVIRSNEYTDTTTWFVQIQNGGGNKIEANFDGNGNETAFVRCESGASRTSVLFNHSGGTLLSDASSASDTFFMGPNSDITKTAAGYNFNVAALSVFRPQNDSGVILNLSNADPNYFQFSRVSSTGALKIQGTQTGFNDIGLVPTSGKVGVGNAVPAYELDVTGDINTSTLYRVGGTAGVSAGSFSTITAIQTVGGIVTVLTGTSDERLKTNIKPFERGLEAVLAINPKLYGWNEEGQAKTGFAADVVQAGFIAQDVQKAIPEAIGLEGEKWLTLDTRPIIAALVNSVKELSQQIQDLKKTKLDG
jgi:hypothetical protein